MLGKKISPWAIVRMALFGWSYIFSRFGTVPAYYRQTDRHSTTACTALA